MKLPEIDNLKELLSIPKNISIITHTNPDGDAIGSSLALYSYLKAKGNKVDVIVPNDFPDFLAWMPNADNILINSRKSKECKEVISNADIIFCLDFNALNRIDKVVEYIRQSNAKKVLIDHHLQPETESFDHCISIIKVSSTSELIYEFITELGDENYINKEISECIFVGIMTDTGSFSFSCNYVRTFEITSKLIGVGLDAEHVHRLVYDTYSENRMRLLGHSLSERLVVLPELSMAYIYLTKEDLKKFNYQVGDTEGVVNYALSIKGIQLAALFTERENKIRISFRSKGNFNVNIFARTHYEGGGHKNAAGANSYISLEETLNRFESILKNDYINELNLS